MTVLLVLCFVVLSIVMYVFFAPFFLEINSIHNLYRIRFHRIASVNIKIINNSLILETRVLGWVKQTDPFTNNNKRKRTQKPIHEIKKKKRKISWQKMRKLLASFKINACHISLDFGDMQLNGILYPLFYFISRYTKKNIKINFVEENYMILEIENSLARMSWAYISS